MIDPLESMNWMVHSAFQLSSARPVSKLISARAYIVDRLPMFL